MSESNLDPSEESTMKTWPDGTRAWYNNKGRYHRLDGSAIEWSDGSKVWIIHDNLIVTLKPKNK